jgi:hypothetical protein
VGAFCEVRHFDTLFAEIGVAEVGAPRHFRDFVNPEIY